jgi:hypothetical protein
MKVQIVHESVGDVSKELLIMSANAQVADVSTHQDG